MLRGFLPLLHLEPQLRIHPVTFAQAIVADGIPRQQMP